MKVVINAIFAKQRGGGGFQIVNNFIKTSINDNSGIEWIYFVSEDFDKFVDGLFDESRDKTYFVFPTQPDVNSHFFVQRRIDKLVAQLKPDVVYSILAPSFFKFDCKEVMRCSNAWNYVDSVNSWAWSSQTFKQRIITRFKAMLVCREMKHSSFFVTQTDVAKRSIMQITGTTGDNVKVVPNVLPAIYLNTKVEKKTDDNIFDIVYVSAVYPHKNIDIIPLVANILKSEYNISSFRFHVTIPDRDKGFLTKFKSQAIQLGVNDLIVNEGYQTQKQLVSLYSKCDLFFFPSLLETFSASLLEAMYFKMPIVATDFDFNIEVAKDAALYFEPQNAEQAAMQISRLICNKQLYNQMVVNGQERIQCYNDYQKHFNEIRDFLIEVVSR